MTTSIENENNSTVIQNSEEKKEQEILTTNEQEQRIGSTHNIEEKNNLNDQTKTNSDSTTTINNNDQHKENIVNNTDDDNRSRKSFNSKVKYSSMPYYRSSYYTNGHPYGSMPYCYYPSHHHHHHPVTFVHEKPTPLMVVSTQSSSTADNQTNNSTTVSPQNLPPRLRQISANENDTNVQTSSSSQSTSTTTTSNSQPTTNGRRHHRSILPRTSSNYYSPYPPPLMATPPGVLYPYQPGHIAYNIRTPDELELLAFQQQFMGLPPPPPPPPLIWPPATTYPHLPFYPMYGSSHYAYNGSSTMDTNNSSLNPEAAEWVPNHTDKGSSLSDDHILIDDEINFPPLNINRIEENNSDQKLPNDSSTSVESSTINTTDKSPSSQSASSSKVDSVTSQDDHRHLSASSKLTTITYSTVILQTPDRNIVEKTANNNSNSQSSRTNHTHTQSSNNKQRIQTHASKENNSRRRQIPLDRNKVNGTRTSLPIETPKQVQSNDDWIEVKSKKTKKFDRTINENSSHKLPSDQSIQKVPSPPSSLSSTGENANTTCTSEEEETSENKVMLIVENKTITTTTTDFNQVIIDDIHNKLNNNERLLIIIRGCPGSGKSTLAKSLNNGYNGQILSIDEYFQDMNSNEHFFDASKIEEVHLQNHQLALDAFKQNISPIIIDNTNTTSNEMKPYVAMGKEAGYEILLIEPQTPWRYKARELVKRNLHNLPLRRIKEILNRFEHNVTVENLIDQLKSNLYFPCQLQMNSDSNHTDTESIDPILTSKKTFDSIDDSTILDDVRLCINDMILFLTSNYYQTSLSIPSSDISSVCSSSSPTTPTTTSHSIFYRPFSRLSSTTSNQDHSFSNEHLLRLSNNSYSRCFESLTPPLSTNSSIIEKKRRKNKNKQTTNEILLNTNNNNNNNSYVSTENDSLFQTINYQVYLPDETSDFIVIDDQSFQSSTSEEHSSRNHSSVISSQPIKTESTNKNNHLVNIIHDQLMKPSNSNDQRSVISTNHIAIQCSSLNDFINENDSSQRILIGRVLSITKSSSPPIVSRPGYKECGIQVDLIDDNINSFENLIEFYSEFLSIEMIKHFYELCNHDISWTRTQIDEYLQDSDLIHKVPTLRQLSLNALNRWNEEIKTSNPSFDSISIGDLLQDINDEDVSEEFILDDNNQTIDSLQQRQSIELSDSKQMTIPLSLINSLQELYGELPNLSTFSYSTDGLSLPLDDELSINIYQALQRFLGVSNQVNRPVNEKKSTKQKKKQTPPPQSPLSQHQQQSWISPSSTNINKKPNGPLMKDIINEELKSLSNQKQMPKRQLDFASQHKLKELERNFSSFPSDVLYDIFINNESDYDLTFVCLSSMLEDNPSISAIPRTEPVTSSSSSTTRTMITLKPSIECKSNLFEISRHHARDYALKRKECYNKADQANRHGMTGVASFYINQAREQTRLMKEANRQACESLSQIRLNQFRQTHRLDLHEFHADEALHLFQQIEQELNKGNRRTTPKSIEIITGYGKNSFYGGGSGKIRSVILNYLRQKNYKYSEPNKGAILVQL